MRAGSKAGNNIACQLLRPLPVPGVGHGDIEAAAAEPQRAPLAIGRRATAFHAVLPLLLLPLIQLPPDSAMADAPLKRTHGYLAEFGSVAELFHAAEKCRDGKEEQCQRAEVLDHEIEAEMAEMEDEDRAMFLAEMGQDEPGLNRLIRAAFKLLGLQTYFTAGVKEVRAWTIHVGDTAPQAAGVIHTDFEKGFIRAQTIAFEDFIQFKGEAGAKDAGKMRAEGKEYVDKDGDVLNFLFNV